MDVLFQACVVKVQEFLRVGLKQNDVRVTFYKHIMNTINSSIHLLIFSDTTLSTQDWWLKKLSKYKINKRFFSTNPKESREKEIDYINQYLLFSYFSFVFHIFESSLRIVCKFCFYDDFYIVKDNQEKQIRDIRDLVETILRKLNLWDDEREKFLEIALKFRNSISNNGVFTKDKQESRLTYTWKHNSYVFNNGKQIKVEENYDLWTEYIRFTREFMSIFSELIDHTTVKKHRFIEDTTEPASA